MAEDPRVDLLLEELLESGGRPEEVCRSCPELLPQVRSRWRRLRQLEQQVDALFPSSHASDGSSPPVIPTGELPHIDGYDVQEERGRGGMGVVYRARHLRLNRPVALKMILAGPYARRSERERFLREAETVAGLSHPNIVPVYDVGDAGGLPYFTMEFVEGGSLAERLTGEPWPARRAAEFLSTLAGAVHAAHRGGILHRDLKPSNVLIAADGTPKVTDFGLARRLDAGEGLTLSGAPIGTPSYMSPCQARGERKAIGPATDVYALGAILYELLTGRPPFRAESATATLQQVITDEPVAPARLNSRVPRDLQTICLKCLEKEPGRRYPSAAALADDLDRFLRGEPIQARPVTPIGRALRWVRRRPSLAALLAATALLSSALVVGGLRWSWQRAEGVRAAVHDAEDDLDEAVTLRRKYDFAGAAAALARARSRLGTLGPAGLHARLDAGARNLDLVKRLDAIHVDRYRHMLVDQRPAVLKGPAAWVAPAVRYEAAFREAGLGTPRDDPAAAAARVRASPVAPALVAALDDWALNPADDAQLRWVLEVARLADPDPWRDRVRDPDTWGDRGVLEELAAEAVVADQSPHLLAVLASRMVDGGTDAEALLRRALLVHPADFYLNLLMSSVTLETREEIGYLRMALRTRPDGGSVHYNLANSYMNQRRWAEAAFHFREAIRLEPFDPWPHHNLALCSSNLGRPDEAEQEFREAVRLDAGCLIARQNLTTLLTGMGRLAEAKEQCLLAFRDAPEGIDLRRELLPFMVRFGGGADARLEWERRLATNPPDHDSWFGYAELCLYLGEEQEYRQARRDLLARFGASTDQYVAERTARACLLAPPSEDELRQIVALLNRVASAPDLKAPHYVQFARGLAEYRLGHFDDAAALMRGPASTVTGPGPALVLAMCQHRLGRADQARKTLASAVLSFDWNADQAEKLDPAWIAHVLRREAESLIVPQWRAFLNGTYQPRETDERLALLGLCQFQDRRAAEARLLEAVFAADPGLAKDDPPGLRHRAARAAAVAGRGGGADGAGLGEDERSRWRRRSREWLRAEVEDWAKQPGKSPAADRPTAERTLASWRADPDLAALRDPRWTEQWPAAERQECLAFWSDIAAGMERVATRRRTYVFLPLDKVATAVSTRGMFTDPGQDQERLIFSDWSPKEFEGVPFHLIDPRGDHAPNAILLHGPRGKIPSTMPKSVRVPCHSAARAVHFLSGVSGWGYPWSTQTSVSMIVRLHYEGGKTEDHPLRNGEHFADYNRRVDVPGSKFAFALRGRQIRYLAVLPQRTDRIEEIELVKGPDETAPVVMAITVETP